MPKYRYLGPSDRFEVDGVFVNRGEEIELTEAQYGRRAHDDLFQKVDGGETHTEEGSTE